MQRKKIGSILLIIKPIVMGYETKLIVGTFYNDNASLNGYVSVIATVDLCKSDFEDTWIDESDKTPENECFFYPDGNTETREDCYGSKLYAVPSKKVLKFMKQHNRKEKYRRYNAAIPMLSSLIKDFEGENLICILLGH